MQFGRLAQIIKILEKYADPEQDCVQPAHDQLYLGDESWPITQKDRESLEKLGVRFGDEGIFVWT